MQVGTGFQQVRGEAVTEQVGNTRFSNPARARIPAGVAWSWYQWAEHSVCQRLPGNSQVLNFLQAPPVCAEFVEQNGTEHYITVLATLAALDVNHHPSLSMSLTFRRVDSASRTPVA